MKKITGRQQEVLSFIADFTKENVYPPTVREISEHFAISLRAVQDHLAALQKKGFLAAGKHRSRALRVLSNGCAPAESIFWVRVPVIGAQCAGALAALSKSEVFCAGNIEKIIQLGEPVCRSGKEYFAFRLCDQNLSAEGIYAGDIAVIEKSDTAEVERFVAVIADGALTLMRCRTEDGELRLENPDKKFVSSTEGAFRVVGVLAGIIRAFGQ